MIFQVLLEAVYNPSVATSNFNYNSSYVLFKLRSLKAIKLGLMIYLDNTVKLLYCMDCLTVEMSEAITI